MLCDAVAGYVHLREQLSGEDLVMLAGDSGYPTPNPLCALMRSQTKAVRELLSDFGMTPASRTSLTGSTSAEPRRNDDADPLAALVAGFGASRPPVKPAAARKKAAARRQRA